MYQLSKSVKTQAAFKHGFLYFLPPLGGRQYSRDKNRKASFQLTEHPAENAAEKAGHPISLCVPRGQLITEVPRKPWICIISVPKDGLQAVKR